MDTPQERYHFDDQISIIINIIIVMFRPIQQQVLIRRQQVVAAMVQKNCIYMQDMKRQLVVVASVAASGDQKGMCVRSFMQFSIYCPIHIDSYGCY